MVARGIGEINLAHIELGAEKLFNHLMQIFSFPHFLVSLFSHLHIFTFSSNSPIVFKLQ